MMREKATRNHLFSDYVLIAMKNLNLLIVAYISLLMACSLQGFVQDQAALEFLATVSRLPLTAWKIPLLAFCLYGGCLFLMSMQNPGGWVLLVKLFLEVGIALLISALLGFSYTGIVLLILADILHCFPGFKGKYALIGVICVVYLLIDYDLLSVYYRIIPLNAYLGYFQSDARSVLLAIKNFISSLNTFLFFVYLIVSISIQLSEKERIMSLNEQLNEANGELQRLTVQLEQYARESGKLAQTLERNRLARELHDTLGHALTGIITGIEACMALMDVAPEATKLQLKAITEVARQGLTDVRRSVKALRPDALEKTDLAGALIDIIEEMKRATNVQVDYQCSTRLDYFNEDEEDIIYRIVQESITNSIRHGRASHIRIRITREYNLLNICVQDNGIGCVNIKKGFGLHHMEERLQMLNGSLRYRGDDGFTLEAQIPIRWGKGGEEDD